MENPLQQQGSNAEYDDLAQLFEETEMSEFTDDFGIRRRFPIPRTSFTPPSVTPVERLNLEHLQHNETFTSSSWSSTDETFPRSSWSSTAFPIRPPPIDELINLLDPSARAPQNSPVSDFSAQSSTPISSSPDSLNPSPPQTMGENMAEVLDPARSDDDETDPLLYVIRQDPLEAIWFIKCVMLCSALLGKCTALPCFYFLWTTWPRCTLCSRPLHYWILIHCVLQIIQAPVRVLFYLRLNRIIPKNIALLRGRNVPLNQITELFLQFYNGRPPQVPPQEGIAIAQQNPFINFVEYRVRLIKVSFIWKISKLFSIFTYGWFILGVVWVLNSADCPSCPELYTVTVIVIYASVGRLVLTLGIFYRSFPSQLSNGRQMKGAKQNEIDALPFVEFTGPVVENQVVCDDSEKAHLDAIAQQCDRCAICLSDFETGEQLRRLPCAHHFHPPCIDTWLKRNKVCPLCLKCIEDTKLNWNK